MSETIPEAAVEAAMTAYYDRGGLRWASAHPETRAIELADMRAALEAAAPHMPGRMQQNRDADLPSARGAAITYRGKLGRPWLGLLTGNGLWNVIRQDTAQGYKPREVEPGDLLDEIGSELTVIHGGLQ